MLERRVEFTTRGEEQKLETYTIYQKYLALVENKLEVNALSCQIRGCI